VKESQFDALVNDTFLRIEEAIDGSGAPIDSETAGGVLTLRFDNGSQIIVNRQSAVRQIWVAARSGGYHFDYHPETGAWRCDKTGVDLLATLSRACTEQAGKEVRLA
jgi:iron-sulfur cluster assembly protein CyaY